MTDIELEKIEQQRALMGLLASIGIDSSDVGGELRIDGFDPVVSSPHRLGTAAATALAAYGAGVAAIWRTRTGRGQDVAVDVRRAVMPGLRTCYHVFQNGRQIQPLATLPFFPEYFFRTADDKWFLVVHYLSTSAINTTLGILRLLNCSHDPGEMAAAVRKWKSFDLEQAVAERKLIGVTCRTREEWLAHPQGQWLATRPPVEVEKIGDSEPVPLSAGERPLSGLRVLDLSHVLAGPVTARMLAEHGADVLRISGPRHRDDWMDFADTGVGKRSAELDLDDAEDADIARRLVKTADVFVQSWRPGSLDRRGFSPAELQRLNSRLVYVSVSAFGSGGPWAERGGYNPVGHAASGLAFDDGSVDAPSRTPSVALNDYLTPYLAAAGVLGALMRRTREGGSYHVKTSLTRASMWVQELGKLPESLRPKQVLSPQPRPSDMVDIQSPCGIIRLPGPIVQLSETQGYWVRGPEPPGASLAEWLPR